MFGYITCVFDICINMMNQNIIFLSSLKTTMNIHKYVSIKLTKSKRNIMNISISGYLNLLKYLTGIFNFFSDKNQNKRTGDSNRFFPKNAPTKVINIAPHTYYEGIEFNNFFFDSFEIDNLCFHNCTFRNCKFSNMTSKKFLWESELKQGFSSCDFYNCTFEKCNFKNLFFSIGNIDLTTFSDVTFFNCIFTE